jgi:hypothetical protein
MTENVSPSPYPLPSRARGYKKNLPSRARGGKRLINNVRFCPIKNVFIIISGWVGNNTVEIMR